MYKWYFSDNTLGIDRGYIYFAKGNLGRYKVGKTKRDPEVRAREQNLELIAYDFSDCLSQAEKGLIWIVQSLGAEMISKEWFRCTDEISDKILFAIDNGHQLGTISQWLPTPDTKSSRPEIIVRRLMPYCVSGGVQYNRDYKDMHTGDFKPRGQEAAFLYNDSCTPWRSKQNWDQYLSCLKTCQ